jgi:hypothetical protein
VSGKLSALVLLLMIGVPLLLMLTMLFMLITLLLANLSKPEVVVLNITLGVLGDGSSSILLASFMIHI